MAFLPKSPLPIALSLGLLLSLGAGAAHAEGYPIDAQETEWNFGRVPVGADLSHSFMIKNVSDADVRPTVIVLACGACLQVQELEGPTRQPQALATGRPLTALRSRETAVLALRNVQNTQRGPFRQQVRLNIPGSAPVTLTISGEIQ